MFEKVKKQLRKLIYAALANINPAQEKHIRQRDYFSVTGKEELKTNLIQPELDLALKQQPEEK